MTYDQAIVDMRATRDQAHADAEIVRQAYQALDIHLLRDMREAVVGRVLPNKSPGVNMGTLKAEAALRVAEAIAYAVTHGFGKPEPESALPPYAGEDQGAAVPYSREPLTGG